MSTPNVSAPQSLHVKPSKAIKPTSLAVQGPHIPELMVLSPTSNVKSPSCQGSPENTRSSGSVSSEAILDNSLKQAGSASPASLVDDADESVLEALKGKDRIYVLKLGEMMESQIIERKERIEVTPATSYQRLLVHRCAAHYRLFPESDPHSKSIILVTLAADSVIPSRRLSDLVPPVDSIGPSFKIMRRALSDRRSRSHNGSVVGEEADLSDGEPSEEGSSSGRKKHMTMEEREAAYNAARLRIFQDFQDKESSGERQISGGSSNQSLASSASTSGGRRSGSADEIDDSASTAATESEWSGPISRKDHSIGSISNTSSRSLRSTAPPFNVGSSVHVAQSDVRPTFSYPSMYDPSMAPLHLYDPSQSQPAPYPYAYYSPEVQQIGHAPSYPYYPYPYPYSVPPQSAPNSGYGPGPGMTTPYNPYAWNPSHVPTSSTPQQMPMSPPTSFDPQYYSPPSPYPPYPMQPFYHPVQHANSSIQSHPSHEDGRSAVTGHNGTMNGLGEHRHHSTGHLASPSGPRRGPPPSRHNWSYGPGVSGSPAHDVRAEMFTPPQMNFGMRRTTSATSSAGSTSTGYRTPGGADDVSSTASSSTTSSSSRRTYTSNSSHHPLPPRPDWAVGLKSGFHSPRSTGSSRDSPARSGHRSLQPADFPPLVPMSPEKRAPALGGVWTNASSTRSILMPNSSHGQLSTSGTFNKAVSVDNSKDDGFVTTKPLLHVDSETYQKHLSDEESSGILPEIEFAGLSLNGSGKEP